MRVATGGPQPSRESAQSGIAKCFACGRGCESAAFAQAMYLLGQRDIHFGEGVTGGRVVVARPFIGSCEEPVNAFVALSRAGFGQKLPKPPLKRSPNPAHIF